MKIKITHLFPDQLGLNGEAGNVMALVKRLEWSGLEAAVEEVRSSKALSEDSSFVFIGSGTVAGQLAALEMLLPLKDQLEDFNSRGIPMLAVGAGWELLGRALEIVDGTKVNTLGIFPSTSKHVKTRASCESYGFDFQGNLTTGYSNHSAEIELDEGVTSLVRLSAGHGNSSINNSSIRNDEGLIQANLMASRLNGPLLPLNPHLADYLLDFGMKRLGLEYVSSNPMQKIADGYALKAREGIEKRLAR